MRTKEGENKKKKSRLKGSEAEAYLKLVSWCRSELVFLLDWSNLFFRPGDASLRAMTLRVVGEVAFPDVIS